MSNTQVFSQRSKIHPKSIAPKLFKIFLHKKVTKMFVQAKNNVYFCSVKNDTTP